MTGLNRIVLATMILAVSGCDHSSPAPSLLSCYQSGKLTLKFDKDRMFSDDGGSVEFSLNKRKIGWVISSNFVLITKNPHEYEFIVASDGPYDWMITDPSANVFKVVSQDGVPFYFGKCLIGEHGA